MKKLKKASFLFKASNVKIIKKKLDKNSPHIAIAAISNHMLMEKPRKKFNCQTLPMHYSQCIDCVGKIMTTMEFSHVS